MAGLGALCRPLWVNVYLLVPATSEDLSAISRFSLDGLHGAGDFRCNNGKTCYNWLPAFRSITKTLRREILAMNRKRTGYSAALMLAAMAQAVTATAAHRTWDNGATNSYWTSSGNWSPDGYSTADHLIVRSGTPTGSMVVTDNGGSITLEGSTTSAELASVSLLIASNREARMDLLDAADLTTTGYAVIGERSSSDGHVTVSDAGSTWTVVEDLDVGESGTGTLTITGGGSVSDANGILGRSAGGLGDVTVDGAGSTWTNDEQLSVGHQGTGSLNVTDSGAVSSAAFGLIGWDNNAVGAVSVTGAGSAWSRRSDLSLGGGAFWTGLSHQFGGAGSGTLEIAGGGSVCNETGFVGYNAGASGDVRVSGLGSTWTNNSALSIGRYGADDRGWRGGLQHRRQPRPFCRLPRRGHRQRRRFDLDEQIFATDWQIWPRHVDDRRRRICVELARFRGLFVR